GDLAGVGKALATGQAALQKKDRQKENKKLQKRHAQNMEDIKNLAEACRKKEEEVNAARENSQNMVDEAHNPETYGVIRGAFRSAEERRAEEKAMVLAESERLKTGRSDALDEKQLKENEDFVRALLKKLIGTYLTTPQEKRRTSEKQATQVNTRVKEVLGGNIVDDQIRSTFSKGLQGKTGEERENLYDEYFKRGEEFDAQHQKAIELYHRLTESAFQNQDDQDQNKVAQQNKLLGETCAVLNKGLSAASIKEEKEKAKELNGKVAALPA
ncbi:MAG TPA: hypothetical protein H9896_00615, partial [Candidatus Pygmaiobacter gallistercoris]|nr:hypothetical protein [Candidatus Pygmaiobacter gallistercoris]